MNLARRRILSLIFIFFFLILTPLICLYATGYRLGSGFFLQKTGILSIETDPAGAVILIDGNPKNKFFNELLGKNTFIKTPADIKNLKPSRYKINLVLKDYWEWEKTVEIKSNETTKIENLKLFKIDQPNLILETPSNPTIKYSYDKKYAVTISDKIYLINLIDNEITSLAQLYDLSGIDCGCVNWSFDNKKVLIGKYLFDINNWQNPIDLKSVIGESATNLKWNINKDNKVYYQNQGAIYAYDLKNQKISKIIDLNSDLDFLPKNDLLYYFNLSSGNATLEILNLDNDYVINKINFPNYKYTFINPQSSYLNLYDPLNKNLYLIDPFSPVKIVKQVLNNIKLTNWLDKNLLLYSSDYEIWLLNLDNSNKELITRIGQEINSLVISNNNQYLIYSTNNGIYILGLEAESQTRSETKILNFNNINNLEINNKGNVLYFYGEEDNDKGFFKLKI